MKLSAQLDDRRIDLDGVDRLRALFQERCDIVARAGSEHEGASRPVAGLAERPMITLCDRGASFGESHVCGHLMQGAIGEDVNVPRALDLGGKRIVGAVNLSAFSPVNQAEKQSAAAQVENEPAPAPNEQCGARHYGEAEPMQWPQSEKRNDREKQSA